MQVKQLALAAMAPVLLAACQTEPTAPVAAKEPVVQPPLTHLQLQAQVHTVDPQKGDTLHLADGTTIALPAQALVDAGGQPITGPVELHYTPVNDAAAIFASGIPMSYRAPGAEVDAQFESAAMFELRCFSGGIPVFVAPEKALTVTTPTHQPDTDYARFFLNEDSGQWEYIGDSKVFGNPAKAELEVRKQALDSLTSTREDLFALHLMGAVDVWMDSKKVGYEKKLESSLEKQLKSRGLKYYTYGSHQDVYFNGRSIPATFIAWKNVDERPMPKGKRWQASLKRLGKTNNYRMTLTDWKTGETRVRQVRAQHKLKDLFAADAAEWFAEYEAWNTERIEVGKQIEATSDMLRSFEVRSFGIHNADRFTKTDNPYFVQATFSLEGDTAALSKVHQVFFVERDRRSVVKFTRWGWNQLCLDTLYPGTFVAVLPGGEMATYTAEDFERHSWPERVGYNAVPTEFPLRKSPKVGSLEELAEIM